MRWRWLVPVVLLLPLWASITAVLHAKRLDSLRRDDVADILAPHPNLPSDVLRKIGFFANHQESSFLNAAREKEPGQTRVCAFGDSFTHGEEVSAMNDYPTLLQGRLDASAPDRFEVLNFGQGWFGFHQTYILWNEVGRQFDCDMILLGPSGFYPDRDTTFNHARDHNPYYLHARYILEGDDVRLIPVPGETTVDRFDEYNRLLPRLPYLRYDDAPPAPLRALLPTGTTIDNPFYYRSGPKQAEARQSYRVLLRKIAESAPRTILLGPRAVTDLADDIAQIETERVLWPRSFPYRAPHNHFGPLGNDLVARQFQRLLERNVSPTVPGIRTRPLETPTTILRKRPPLPLSRYDRLQFRLGGKNLGNFVRGATQRTRGGTARRVHEDGVQALLLAGTPSRFPHTDSSSPLDGCFLELPRPVANGTPIVLEQGDSTEQIGEVRLWNPRLAVGEIVLHGRARDRLLLKHENHGGALILPAPLDPAIPAGTERARIRVDGTVILEGAPELLHSAVGTCWLIRASGRTRLDIDYLPASGLVELSAQRAKAPPLRAPIARWERIAMPLFQ